MKLEIAQPSCSKVDPQDVAVHSIGGWYLSRFWRLGNILLKPSLDYENPYT